MLLFSTILDINKSLTKEGFIRLVIKWNQESQYESNIIPDIQWNGERNIRFGDECLWMAIEEYRNKNIIAVRFEKVEKDGVIWDTDYIMNFDEMRMAIQLDRSYTEEALKIDPEFSTPHFITILIEQGYLKEDCRMPVLRTPIDITADNLDTVADIVNNGNQCRLPIVYVSKTVNEHNPVNVSWLSSRLKGVAHVLVQTDRHLNYKLRELCNDQNEFNGAIGIYYPNQAMHRRRFLYNRYSGEDPILLSKVVSNIIKYCNSQNLDNLYTWEGVRNSLLTDKLTSQRKEREAAENKVDKIYDTFDEDFKRWEQQVNELTRTSNALKSENQGLRAKLDKSDSIPILTLGEEDEFYQDEIKDMVLCILTDELNSIKEKTRKADVINDLILKNEYKGIGEQRKEKIKNILKGGMKMSIPLRQQLIDMGFEISEEGKHYKLTYFGDARYCVTMAKTASDAREGKNMAATIVREMF